MIRFANPETMPRPASNYSQIAETVGPGRRLVLSGQIGVMPDGAVCSGYRAQAAQAWRNVIAGLEAADMSVRDITAIRVYDVAPGEVAVYREIRDKMLAGHAPASTYVIVAGLASQAFLTEIEVEAFSAS